MTFQHKNILLISPEPWGSSFVSKHHYAVELAKRGNQVTFLGPPSQDYRVQPSEVENLTLAEYPGFPKGLRFLPKAARHAVLRRITQKLEKLVGQPYDIVWSFDNSVFFDLDAWGDAKKTISHIVDLNMDFETAKAATSANLCLCTTELILARLKAFNPRSFKIPHGVVIPTVFPTPKTLPGGSAVKAIYIGNLSMPYLDWDVLQATLQQNPEVQFSFIGPEGKSNLVASDHQSEIREAVKTLPNAHFMGPVPAKEVLAYLLGADICLVSYQEKHHKDQASPHKITEYLASGRVVVATYTAEYAGNDLLQMTERNADFPGLFTQVVNQLNQHNSPEAAARRQAYARSHTYPALVDQIEELLYG